MSPHDLESLLDELAEHIEAFAVRNEPDAAGPFRSFLAANPGLVDAVREQINQFEMVFDAARSFVAYEKPIDEHPHSAVSFCRVENALRKAVREYEAHARVRAAYDATIADSWRAEIAKLEARIAELTAQASELPGLTATLDELFWIIGGVRGWLARFADDIPAEPAIGLLEILDRVPARPVRKAAAAQCVRRP